MYTTTICYICNGSGEIKRPHPGIDVNIGDKCPICDGTGQSIKLYYHLQLPSNSDVNKVIEVDEEIKKLLLDLKHNK
jgi:DnaJ-class molecular chaperone